MDSDISGKRLWKIIFCKFFASDIVIAFVNIILPIVISIRCTNFSDDGTWWTPTIIICLVIALFNIVSVIAKKYQEKSRKNLNMIYRCYNEQTNINSKAANNIFRLNKRINEYISEKKPVSKKVFDKIADFQTTSFIISESLYKMLISEYGDDIDCEITIMNKSNNKIKMIAYSNKDNKVPSSYSKEFKTDDDAFYFVKIFENSEGNIVCLPDKKSVNDHFKKIEGSISRENNICQYIGIPIKTNRNCVELLLQIDVSKEKTFGKNESEILIFAKNILYPYAVLLHKSYERDLIFSQYYDMIISVLNENK